MALGVQTAISPASAANAVPEVALGETKVAYEVLRLIPQ